MKNVTIRRCPTCPVIGSHTDQLASELRNDPNMTVNVIDGAPGEFNVEVGWRLINPKNGDSFRSPSEVAAEIGSGEEAVR